MDKVKEIALITSEKNGLTYIRPDYEYILAASGLSVDDVTDFEDATRNVVHRQLILERDMRNAQNDISPIVMKWLYDVINTVVEPAIVEQQNELIKDMLAYRKEKNAIDTRTLELDKKEQMLEEQSKILPMTFGMNFSKKKP
jgi:hypothetical protein